MKRGLAALILCLCCAPALADYDAQPRRPIDLSGHWKLNPALSDDAAQMLDELLEAQARRYARDRRAAERARPPGAPALDSPPERPLRPWQRRELENYRRMLAIGDRLTIEQDGAEITLISAFESRRVIAGSRTQVSMPQGELADSEVGWDGEWFVIERTVRRGPRALEKLRLTKDGRLEYYMRWGGDTDLAGLKIRRIYDRMSAAAGPANADAGPVR
jgi:hypothetical protein